MDCESCGATVADLDTESECRGCGLIVCQSCVDVFQHMGTNGLHGQGDPAEEVTLLRDEIARSKSGEIWTENVALHKELEELKIKSETTNSTLAFKRGCVRRLNLENNRLRSSVRRLRALTAPTTPTKEPRSEP